MRNYTTDLEKKDPKLRSNVDCAKYLYFFFVFLQVISIFDANCIFFF